MTIVDVIKKALLPLAAMVFWLWMVKTIMGVTGNTDLFMFLFLAGLPFGIHKMCIILIPRGYDVGGTVGMIALLNMDEKETVMEVEGEQDEEKEEHQSLYDRITAIKQNRQRQEGKEPAMRTTETCIG